MYKFVHKSLQTYLTALAIVEDLHQCIRHFSLNNMQEERLNEWLAGVEYAGRVPDMPSKVIEEHLQDKYEEEMCKAPEERKMPSELTTPGDCARVAKGWHCMLLTLQRSALNEIFLEAESAITNMLVDVVCMKSEVMRCLLYITELLLVLGPKSPKFERMQQTFKRVQVNCKVICTLPLPNENNATLLHVAAGRGDWVVLSMALSLLNMHSGELVEKELNKRDAIEYTPIFHAATKGQYAMLKVLLDSKA